MATKTPSDDLDEVLHVVESTTRASDARSPPMEIIEEPNAFVLSCEMPGAEREDIRVDVSPHRVVVAALPRRAPSREPGAYTDFERSIPLPSEVKPEGAEARLNNGVLEVILPKKSAGGSGVYRLPAQ